MMDFVLKMMEFVSNVMDFVLKMMDFGGVRGPPRLMIRGSVFGEGCVSQLFVELEQPTDPKIGFRTMKPHLRTQSATAETDCDLRFLTLNDLEEIGRSYPSLIMELSTLFSKRRRHSIDLHRNAQAAVTIQKFFRGFMNRRRFGVAKSATSEWFSLLGSVVMEEEVRK